MSSRTNYTRITLLSLTGNIKLLDVLEKKFVHIGPPEAQLKTLYVVYVVKSRFALVVEYWTTSLSCWACLRVCGSLHNQSCSLWTWRRGLTVTLSGSSGMCFRSVRYLTHCYDPFGPHFAVRAWTYWQLFAPGVGLGQVFMVKFKIFENPWISTPYKTLFKYQKHIFPIIL